MLHIFILILSPISQNIQLSLESMLKEATVLLAIKSDLIVHFCDIVRFPDYTRRNPFSYDRSIQQERARSVMKQKISNLDYGVKRVDDHLLKDLLSKILSVTPKLGVRFPGSSTIHFRLPRLIKFKWIKIQHLSKH